MARAIRAICLGLAALIAVAWISVYVYVGGLACAFSNANSCSIRMPWQMRGEDFIILVLTPGALVLALLLAAWFAHRRIKAARGE